MGALRCQELPRTDELARSRYQMRKGQLVADVFVSHAEEDGDIAVTVARGLESAGYTTWLYERDILPGLTYLIQVDMAIEQAQAVVLIISPDSLDSRHATNEVIRAYEGGKPFVPILHRITHGGFQRRRPEWRIAIGAAASVCIPDEGVGAILPRVVAGLKALGIQPQRGAILLAGTASSP